MVTRQAHISSENRRSIRLKTDSMQTRMKMDRKRKSAVGTVIKNVKWSSVFWRETEMVGGEVSLVKLNTFMLWPWVNQSRVDTSNWLSRGIRMRPLLSVSHLTPFSMQIKCQRFTCAKSGSFSLHQTT